MTQKEVDEKEFFNKFIHEEEVLEIRNFRSRNICVVCQTPEDKEKFLKKHFPNTKNPKFGCLGVEVVSLTL